MWNFVGFQNEYIQYHGSFKMNISKKNLKYGQVLS